MAAPAPVAPAGTAAAAPLPSLRQYSEYFASDARDTYGGIYGPLLNEFRTEDAPPTGVDLYNAVVSADPQHSVAYLTLREQGGQHYYQVVHSVSKYGATIGLPTPWDNSAFAFVGDIVEGLITTVDLPTDAFLQSNGVNYQNVPISLVRAQQLLTDNPTDDFVGPFADTDAQIRPARTRHYVPLPHRYVNLFLDRQVPARAGFIDLSTIMQAHGDDVACPALVDWLLLSITRALAGGPPRLSRAAPTVPLADRNLLEHRRRIMLSHVPGQGIPAPQSASGVLETQLEDLVNEQRLSRRDAERRAQQSQAPPTVRKFFGAEVTNTLKALCRVADEDDLPKLWKDLAGAGKRDRQALEQAILAKARTLRTPEAGPIATPSLVKRISGLQWAGLSSEDLTEGIQPFSLILGEYVGSDAGQEAQRQADDYDVMAGTSTTSTLSDAQVVRAGKAVVPLDFGEARAHLVALMVLWTVILGDEHPFVVAYGNFVHSYTANEYKYTNKLKALGTVAPAPALLLRHVQLRMVNYWRKALSQGELPRTPDFEEILDKLEMQDRSWLPDIPTKYWKAVQKQTPTGTLSTTSTVMSDLTGGVPSVVTPPGSVGGGNRAVPGKQPEKEKEKQVASRNPGVNPIFAPFEEKIKSMTFKAAIAKGGQPPTVTRKGAVVPMCLSFHLGGICWSGCSRSGDHGAHTETEDNELLHWCQTCYA